MHILFFFSFQTIGLSFDFVILINLTVVTKYWKKNVF